jgi:hypothetical protein
VVNDPNTAQRWYLINVNESRLVSAIIKPLDNGTSYYVWIKTVYQHGVSEYSEVQDGIPLPPPFWADPISPAVTTGDGELSVSWSEAVNASGYEVYYSSDATPPAENLSGLTSDAGRGLVAVTGVTEAIIPGLTNGQDYYLYVRAVNSAGHSAFSTPSIKRPVGATGAPAAPVISLIGGDKRLTISWKAVQWAKSYKVYYSLTETIPASPIADSAVEITITGQDVRAVISSGIANNTTYHVWVRASNLIGDSNPSLKAGAETKPKPPLDHDNASFVIGEAKERFINEDPINGDRLSRKKETALGDMVCDSCTWYVREALGETIDFVYQNGGLITGALAKGTITVGAIKGILPYQGDTLTILTMKGIRCWNCLSLPPSGAMAEAGAAVPGPGEWYPGKYATPLTTPAGKTTMPNSRT